MRSSARYLPLLVLVLGAGTGAALLPAVAGSETPPKVEAQQTGMEGIYPIFAWTPSSSTIGAGGAVTFSTGATTAEHGIVWLSGPEKPACESAVPVGEEHFRSHWSGACTFAKAGTYQFRCSFHEYMKGTIVVSAAVTTTTTTSTSSASAPPGGGPPPPVAPLGAVLVPAVQRGHSVHGSASVGEAGSRLEVDLLAARASLAAAKSHGSLLVGRVAMGSVGPGKVVFAVRLRGARATRALRRHRRLALKLVVKVTPPGGATVSEARTLTLKP
jgi:plastocyanin